MFSRSPNCYCTYGYIVFYTSLSFAAHAFQQSSNPAVYRCTLRATKTVIPQPTGTLLQILIAKLLQICRGYHCRYTWVLEKSVRKTRFCKISIWASFLHMNLILRIWLLWGVKEIQINFMTNYNPLFLVHISLFSLYWCRKLYIYFQNY